MNANNFSDTMYNLIKYAHFPKIEYLPACIKMVITPIVINIKFFHETCTIGFSTHRAINPCYEKFQVVPFSQSRSQASNSIIIIKCVTGTLVLSNVFLLLIISEL